MHTKVWLITGCSTGFGRELASQLLAQGQRVVVTARALEDIRDLAAHPNALAAQLDVLDQASIDRTVAAAIAAFGRLDVLINNAGVGYFGSFEDSDLDAVRRMFEINVWGLTTMTRAVLPHMRAQHQGTLVNISSIGGLCAFPSLSFYNATKFAVEALSEGLAQEVAPLGIRMLIVEPSGFRTDWAGRSAGMATHTQPAYDATVGTRMAAITTSSGKQAGDPTRAATAIIAACNDPAHPMRLLLGKNALDLARQKLTSLAANVEAVAETAAWADAPPT